MSFIPLHINTCYTFLKSGILIKSLIKNAVENKINTLGISDYNVLFGYPEFDKLTREANLDALFGMDLIIEENKLSLYIKNEKGYQNLSFLSTLLQERGENLNLEDFKKINLQGLICVLSSSSKLLTNTILDLPLEEISSTYKNEFAHFEKDFFEFSKIFENFFIGLEIYQKEMIPHADNIRNFAQNHSYNIIAFPEIKYLKKEDAYILEMFRCIDKEEIFDENKEILDSHYFFKNDEEITKFYTTAEIKDTNLIKDLINFKFNQKRGTLLEFQENDLDSETLLKEKILQGLKDRQIVLDQNENYRDRLNEEFLTIKKLGYCDYFLIVQDYVNYAREHDIIVGPGRGSAAGSLVSYLLKITEIDPIKYNLLFERFLNKDRKTMPDIDIDFADIHRDEIFDYLVNKYGKERCARVITFQTIAAKQSLKDVGKILNYGMALVDSITKKIPNNFNQNKYTLDLAYEKIPAFKNFIDSTPDYQRIFNLAHKIEGFPRQKGIHAAGIILNNEQLLNTIPLTVFNDSFYQTQYEKDYLEDQGFLKFDILGLSNLTTIANCLRLIKKEKNIDLKYQDIPTEEPLIFDLLKTGRVMGLFQIDASAGFLAIKSIKPDNFLEVVDAISLARPGPIQYLGDYVKRKNNPHLISYPSASLKPILSSTYGIIIYQEQIMQIARIYAGFSFSEADNFRRAISKKHSKEIMALKDNFIKGALKLNHNVREASEIYEMILKFANYGFNLSHAVSYASITCQMAYLKAKYPHEFYCSIFESQYGSNDAKFNKYLAEIKKFGIKVLLPNINKSSILFKIEGNNLRMPLLGITNFPRKSLDEIILERTDHGEFKDFEDFCYRMSKKITLLQTSKLIDAGCFDDFTAHRQSLKKNLHSVYERANLLANNEGFLVGAYGIDKPLIYDNSEEEDIIERMNKEYEALGVLISDNPLNYLNLSSIEEKITSIDDLILEETSAIVGIIKQVKTITVRNGKDKGKPMAFLTLYDQNDEIDVTLFSDIYAQYEELIHLNSIILVKGKLILRKEQKSFNAYEIKRIEVKL